MFFYKIKADVYSDKRFQETIVTVANTISQAAKRAENYYGVDNIISLEIESCSEIEWIMDENELNEILKKRRK